MNMDSIPTWAFFVGTIFLVLITIEVGYRLGGLSHRKPDDEKDSAAVSATLALAAFMPAFTFGIVADRYQARRGLVRDQGRLWNMAVINARKDMNSDVAALYIESINEVMGVHASRVDLGVRARIPMSIWIVLWGLTILGLLSLGYQTAIDLQSSIPAGRLNEAK